MHLKALVFKACMLRCSPLDIGSAGVSTPQRLAGQGPFCLMTWHKMQQHDIVSGKNLIQEKKESKSLRSTRLLLWWHFRQKARWQLSEYRLWWLWWHKAHLFTKQPSRGPWVLHHHKGQLDNCFLIKPAGERTTKRPKGESGLGSYFHIS